MLQSHSAGKMCSADPNAIEIDEVPPGTKVPVLRPFMVDVDEHSRFNRIRPSIAASEKPGHIDRPAPVTVEFAWLSMLKSLRTCCA